MNTYKVLKEFQAGPRTFGVTELVEMEAEEANVLVDEGLLEIVSADDEPKISEEALENGEKLSEEEKVEIAENAEPIEKVIDEDEKKASETGSEDSSGQVVSEGVA